jgi:hypothetical protein
MKRVLFPRGSGGLEGLLSSLTRKFGKSLHKQGIVVISASE